MQKCLQSRLSIMPREFTEKLEIFYGRHPKIVKFKLKFAL